MPESSTPSPRTNPASIPRVLVDEAGVGELIEQLTLAIEQNVINCGEPDSRGRTGDAIRWAVVGIRSRGDVLAKRIANRLREETMEAALDPSTPLDAEQLLWEREVGSLDITLYRDDLSEVGGQPVVRTTDIPFRVDGLNVILIDDVLMTGRSARAAIQSLIDLGRPRRIWLAVLVDRGGRELPIAPDFAALDLTKSSHTLDPADHIQVRLKPADDVDEIEIVRSR